MRCPSHPDNVEAAAKMARSPNPRSLSLPIRSRNGFQAQRGEVQYQSIDHRQTRERNRLEDARRGIDPRNLVRRQGSDEEVLLPDNRSRDDHPYNNRSHSQEDLDRTNRPRTGCKNNLIPNDLLTSY